MEDLEKSAKFNQAKEISPSELERYRAVQEIAKDTIQFLKNMIREGVTEKQIADDAEYYLKQKGIDKFWYHGKGALVFVGERTTLSISGKNYVASEEKVGKNDIVTVDLSPEIDGFWGDFARTFVVADGKINSLEDGGKNSDEEINHGLEMEKILHLKFREMISESMSLEEAYLKINSLIEKFGFENLDFKNNLGHSIEKDPNDRVYIESGNRKTFGEIGLFTFEPHIRAKGGKYGFKREDVYYFQNGKLNIL